MAQRVRWSLVAVALGVTLGGALLAPRAALADAPAEDVGYRQILVTWRGARGSEATRTKEEALAIANAVQAEAARPGADVAAIAAARSEGIAKGGIVEFLRYNDPEPFTKAVEALKVGDVTPPFETEVGWNVVQRIPRDEALAILSTSSAAFVGARVPWSGTLDPVRDRTKEQALADAQAAVAALRAGKRFEELPPALRVVSYSKKGWMAKTLRKGSALREFRAIEDAAFATPIGQVSDPIDSPIGWVVLRRVPWFHARVKHIVIAHLQAQNIAPTVRRSRAQARERAEDLLTKLKVDPAAWGKLVLESSDEASTAQNGGDLGILEPGYSLPEREEAVAGMKPGSITARETRFGYEVLWRVD